MMRRRGCGWIVFWTVVLSGWFGASPGLDAGEITGSVGFASMVRSGRWATLRLTGTVAGEGLWVESLDGEGVRYRHLLEPSSEEITTMIPMGAIGAPVEVYRAGAAGERGERVWETRLLEGVVPSDRPWVVTLGESLGLEQIGSSSLLRTTGTLAVSRLEDPRELPSHWLGYDGVDWVVVSAQSREIAAGLETQQQQAILDWVRAGGKMFVSLGAEGSELLSRAPWLAAALGAEGVGDQVLAQPAAIESFILARTPIEEFPATNLRMDAASRVLLSGKTTRQGEITLLAARSLGFGQIVVFAGGLAETPLALWKQREDLLEKMLPGLLLRGGESRKGGANLRGDLRYGDLAGQLRGTLDQFSTTGQVPFSAVAALVLALIALIGPLDYWLINRWLGRPLGGWITFPLMVLGFSAGVLWWRGSIEETAARQVTVVDIDSATGFGRGFAWTQVYSGQAREMDLRLQGTSGVAPGSGLAADTVHCGPWGYPGVSFGGLEIAGEDFRLPAYRLVMPAGGNGASELAEVPFAPRSSRSIAGIWQLQTALEPPIPLARRTGSDLLTGALKNPLSVDLLDGWLLYRGLIYTLPTRFRSGETIANLDSIQAKNFRWKLNRRLTSEKDAQSQPWNPGEKNDLSRLMEIVLFYQAAGGEKYVALGNTILGSLDLSPLLTEERAILVGRCEQPEVELRIDGQSLAASAVTHQTYVRLLLPVAPRSDALVPAGGTNSSTPAENGR